MCFANLTVYTLIEAYRIEYSIYWLTQCYSFVKYRVAHEKPARRLVDQRELRSRTLYRKLNKCKCEVLTG